MGRPTREQAAISAMLAELRRIELEEIEAWRLHWRLCPATQHLHPDFRRSCDECHGVVCAKMQVIGLADDGSPLPRKDRHYCGARTRSGSLCKNKVVPGKRRCKFHGGLSTGPKTEAGRARIAEAQRERWQKWKRGHTSKPQHDEKHLERE